MQLRSRNLPSSSTTSSTPTSKIAPAKVTGASVPPHSHTAAMHDPLLSERLPQPPSYSSTAQQHDGADDVQEEDMDFNKLSRKSQWITLAIASGACAAFNGVFAKLTTTTLTTTFANSIAHVLGLDSSKVVEVIIRGMFFGLNLIFNGVMWTLFTKALTHGTSTTQVSILNTSSNFMVTALLGLIVFSESLPPMWWLGAALLVVGNVIIGRREEKDPTEESTDVETGMGVEEEGLLAEEIELDREGRDDADVLDLEDDLLKSEDEEPANLGRPKNV